MPDGSLTPQARAHIAALFEKLSPESRERFLAGVFEMFNANDRRSLVLVLEMMDEESRQNFLRGGG